LLARLDALVALVADRHGLALLPDGRLAAAEARVAARATGLAGSTGGRGRTVVERDAVELLRCVAEGVGLLRARGDRLEATSLRHAWTQIDESLRAGLTYAAWCQQVTLPGRAGCLTDPSFKVGNGQWARGGAPLVLAAAARVWKAAMPSCQAAWGSASAGRRRVSSSSTMPWAKAKTARASWGSPVAWSRGAAVRSSRPLGRRSRGSGWSVISRYRWGWASAKARSTPGPDRAPAARDKLDLRVAKQT
jgi:hypothetical protein